MKKIFLFITIFFIGTLNVLSKDKIEVNFSKCVDGDTAKVILKKEEITLRFLAIDTPETKHPKKGEEPYGKEASNYTCNSLKKAKKIEIEYDNGSDKLDKYNRHLVWVFVDGDLLQAKLIEKGYAKVAYLYGDYKYTSKLEKLETKAKANKLGVWEDEEDIDYLTISIAIIIIVISIILFITNENYRNKETKKIKKKINKILKK